MTPLVEGEQVEGVGQPPGDRSPHVAVEPRGVAQERGPAGATQLVDREAQPVPGLDLSRDPRRDEVVAPGLQLGGHEKARVGGFGGNKGACIPKRASGGWLSRIFER